MSGPARASLPMEPGQYSGSRTVEGFGLESHYIVHEDLLPPRHSNFRHLTCMQHIFGLLEFKSVLELLFKTLAPSKLLVLTQASFAVPSCPALLSIKSSVACKWRARLHVAVPCFPQAAC